MWNVKCLVYLLVSLITSHFANDILQHCILLIKVVTDPADIDELLQDKSDKEEAIRITGEEIEEAKKTEAWQYDCMVKLYTAMSERRISLEY